MTVTEESGVAVIFTVIHQNVALMAADSPGDVFATESHRDLRSVMLFVSTCLSNVFPWAEFREHPRCFAKQLTGGPTCHRKRSTCIEDLMMRRLPLSYCASLISLVSWSVIIKILIILYIVIWDLFILVLNMTLISLLLFHTKSFVIQFNKELGDFHIA